MCKYTGTRIKKNHLMKDFFLLYLFAVVWRYDKSLFFFGADFLSLHSISHAMLCFWNPSSLLSDSVDFDILCKNKGVYGIFSELRSGDGGASSIGGYKLHTASSTVSARMKKMGPCFRGPSLCMSRSYCRSPLLADPQG